MWSVLAMSLLFVSCGDDDEKKENPTVQKLSKRESVDGKDTQTAVLTYGDNGYVSKMEFELREVDTDGKVTVSKGETYFYYNTKKQLIKEESFDVEKGTKKLDYKSTYVYNDEGLITSEVYTDMRPNSDGVVSENIRTTTYEYNTKGLLVKETKDVYVTIYEYNTAGKLVKKYKEGGTEVTTFSFDDKKSPFTGALPLAYMRISPNETGENNLLMSEYGSYKSIYEYTYDANGYPVSSIEKEYEKDVLQKTSTVKFTY